MGKFIALVIAAGVGAIVGRHVQPSELSVGLAAVLLIVVFAVVVLQKPWIVTVPFVTMILGLLFYYFSTRRSSGSKKSS